MKNTVLFAFLLCLSLSSINAYSLNLSPNLDHKWKNTEWSEYLIEALSKSEFVDVIPKDYKKYNADFPNFSREERIQFWAHLMVLLSEKESSYNPNCSYKENFLDSTNTNVISRGLFQLSFDSATISYRCKNIKVRKDIYKPKVNIDCAVKIFNHWVTRDKVVASFVQKGERKSWRGPARYWSTLRLGKKFEKIRKQLVRYVRPYGISFDDAGEEISFIPIYVGWNHGKYYGHLINELEKSSLIDIKLTNSKGYIGEYNEYNRDQRLAYWAHIFAWLATNVESTSLFGITPEVAKKYGCSKEMSDLNSISCAVKIAEGYVTNDQRITGYSSATGKRVWQGTSLFWEELRDLEIVKDLLQKIIIEK